MDTPRLYHTVYFHRMARADEHQQRLDRSLTKLPAEPSKHLIQRLIRKGAIKINGEKVAGSYRIQPGDCISFPQSLNNSLSEQTPSAASYPLIQICRTMADYPLYEDQALLVCNKPAGIAVHGGTKQQCGIILAMRSLYPQCTALNLAHRLDQGTSGILIFCKDLIALRGMHAQFASENVYKEYTALVSQQGMPLREKWKVSPCTEDIQEKKQDNELKRKQKKIDPSTCFLKMPIEGITEFTVLENLPHAFTLLHAYPKQGKKHQIRKHLQISRCTIVGESQYRLDTEAQKHALVNPQIQKLQKLLPSGGFYLHASLTKFEHPITRETLVIQAPFPLFWREALTFLNSNYRQNIFKD